jgi:hypothetical protein
MLFFLSPKFPETTLFPFPSTTIFMARINGLIKRGGNALELCRVNAVVYAVSGQIE